MTIRRFLFIGIVILALVVGFAGGFLFIQHQNSSAVEDFMRQVINKETDKPTDVDFSLFWQVWNALHDKYVDQSNLGTQKLVYGAIEGMVSAAGDDYTTFFPPEESKKFQEEISGSFSGVGLEMGERNGAITVISPLRDTPAFRAGVMAGDVVVKIDGVSTEHMALEEAVTRIRGIKGTSVVLTVLRDGETTTREFTIVRDTIKVPAIDWKLLDGHIAYVEIFIFNENVFPEFVRAAQEILNSPADRLIIDVRNNPGGLLDSAVSIAGWFLDNGSLVVKEDFGNGVSHELRSDGAGQLKKYPTIVLINGGSASASEILAGALHDNLNTPLVGEKSFGKGSVQEIQGFYDGSSLKVTVAKWLTPNGISISEKGIEPTVLVATPASASAESFIVGTPGKDPQLDRAIQMSNDLSR